MIIILALNLSLARKAGTGVHAPAGRGAVDGGQAGGGGVRGEGEGLCHRQEVVQELGIPLGVLDIGHINVIQVRGVCFQSF